MLLQVSDHVGRRRTALRSGAGHGARYRVHGAGDGEYSAREDAAPAAVEFALRVTLHRERPLYS